eukprot:5578328-Pyramimonas_sp.AAC.1
MLSAFLRLVQTAGLCSLPSSDWLLSPQDETLNTLKYAHRTRNIRNKVVVNRDPACAELMYLRQQ